MDAEKKESQPAQEENNSAHSLPEEKKEKAEDKIEKITLETIRKERAKVCQMEQREIDEAVINWLTSICFERFVQTGDTFIPCHLNRCEDSPGIYSEGTDLFESRHIAIPRKHLNMDFILKAVEKHLGEGVYAMPYSDEDFLITIDRLEAQNHINQQMTQTKSAFSFCQSAAKKAASIKMPK